MKRIFLVLIVISLTLIQPSYAHSGRTDSNGGHYDRSTGEYHYHHGFPAHQHTNGVCPYNNIDMTGKNSGSSSGGKGSSSSFSIQKEEKEDDEGWTSIVIPFLVIFGLLFLPEIILTIIGTVREFLNRDKIKQQIEQEEEERKKRQLRIEEEKKRKELQYQEEKEIYIQAYSGKSMQDIAYECGMPENAEIRSDGRPHTICAPPNEDEYVVFCSEHGKKFHRTDHCNYAARKPVHVLDVKILGPCCKCNPSLPNTSWYQQFSDIMKTLKQYGIHVPLFSLSCFETDEESDA